MPFSNEIDRKYTPEQNCVCWSVHLNRNTRTNDTSKLHEAQPQSEASKSSANLMCTRPCIILITEE